MIRMKTGGHLAFWTLENSIAGRGRRYGSIVIDEAAFGKNGDNKTDGSLMSIWEKSIKPTLYDFGGSSRLSVTENGQIWTVMTAAEALSVTKSREIWAKLPAYAQRFLLTTVRKTVSRLS